MSTTPLVDTSVTASVMLRSSRRATISGRRSSPSDYDRRAVQHDDLMRPVELVGLARGKTQRDVGFRGQRAARSALRAGIPAAS